MPLQWPWSRKSLASSPAKSFPSGIKLIHEGEKDVVDIIFIHGLTGDRERTWTAKHAPLPWIKTLLPSKIPHARIFTFGYDAYVADWRGVVSKNSVGNHSMNLITAVAAYRDNDNTNTRPIIFVCHSLGGLVCKDALIASRQRPERYLQNIFLSTRGIAFLGSPHSGAGLAEWGSKLAKSIGLLKQTNAQIVAVLETESEVLARIQDNFHTMIRSREQHGLSQIWITCFYEELPLAGVGVVVPHHSAVIPGYTSIGIHKHHRDMTKFETDDDPGFLAIVGELRCWIKELRTSISKPMPTAVSFQKPLQEERRDKDAQIEHEQSPSFQSSKITARDSLISQTMQQTFYSNVNRRTVGNFVTRQDVQQELTRWLLNDSSPLPVVLCGIGGSGKTQLAIQCCREAEESGYLATLWIDSSSPTSVEQSYNAIAKALHKDFADENDIQTTISLVQNTLRSWSQKWLMVFDNYDNPKAFQKRSIREYIPESKNGYILFTSRHTGLELLGGYQISVSSMTKSESLDLLLRRPPSNPAEETEGLMVADLLGHLALALDQAGAYIRARKLPLKDFMSHYEKRKDVMFREVPDDWEYRDQSGPLSVFTTWEMSFGLIGGDSETIAWKNNFLTLAGFFDPKRISERYFQAYCDAENVEWMDLFRVDGKWDSYQFGDVLAELHKLSLIQLPDQESGERSFTIHPIVCDWLVHRRGKTKRQQMTMELIHALAAFLKCSDEEDLPLEVNQETTLHLDRCVRHAKAAFVMSERDGLGSLPEVDSLFARFYRKQGRYPDAEWLLKLALAENERALGPQHPNSLRTLENLAIISRRQGNYKIAEQLFKRALAQKQESLTSVSIDTIPGKHLSNGQSPSSGRVDILRTIQMLANVYSDQGRYDEAEDLFEQALTGMEVNMGPNHLETLSIRQNLANVYQKRGRYEDAELLYQSALEVKETELGPEHPDTLGTIENLANVYRKQRRYIEAEKMFSRSVESKEKKLGPDHPETLRAVQNLANVYSDQEQYNQAEALYQRALEGNEKLLGLEHPDTLRTVENLENLSIIYYRHRDFEKAETLLKQALAAKEKRVQNQNPDTLRTLRNLGNVHYQLGRYDEAELEYKRVLDCKEKLEQHDIGGTIQSLARVYRKQGRLGEAEQLMLSSEVAISEAQPEKEQKTASPRDVTSQPSNSESLNDLTVPLPRGRLSLSVHQGRGLRPSGVPCVICQFQGATYVSMGPLDDENEEIEGVSSKGKGPKARDAGEDIDLAELIATPSSDEESRSTDPQPYQTEPKFTQWIVNPKWDWTVTFDVFGNDTDLDVLVYDSSDRDATFLGSVRLHPRLTEPVLHDEKWYSLRSQVDGKGPSITGEVHLSINFQKTERKNYGPEDFQVTKCIGKGTHGQVFQMRKKDTQCLYAVKTWSKTTLGRVMNGSPQNDNSWYLRPRIPKMPFIADTKFFFQTPTDLFIATDYIPGGELFWHLQREGRFDEDRSRFYVAEIVLAFQHLHNHDIICRDFKPENILLGATGHITLCHFGLSEGYKSLTKGKETDDFSGATEYLAPEAILDPNGCTNMVDFWTLGVLVFEMCCGWSPFYDEDITQMYKNIAFGKVRFPRDTLSVEGRNFVKGLLNRNPSHRLGSANGAEDLKRHPWFAATDWNALAKRLITPPFIPMVDFGFSELEITAAALTTSIPISTFLSPGMQANFKGFTFVDEATMSFAHGR